MKLRLDKGGATKRGDVAKPVVEPAVKDKAGSPLTTPSRPPAPGEQAPLKREDINKTPATEAAQGPSSMLTLRAPSAPHPFVDEIRTMSANNAARLRAENLELLKDQPDPAAALAKLEEEVTQDLEVLVRRSARGFAGVLRDLRMKTVWEQPGKRDDQYLGYREEVERNLGFFDHRPSYGYASTSDLMKGACTEYGDVIVKLRDVQDRVTFCLFDSFDQGTRENFEQNCYTWADVPQLIVNQKLNKLFEEMPFAYDEAQIFGGVNAADISRVDLPVGEDYDGLAAKTRDLLPWVEVHRYAKPTSDAVSFGASDDA